MRLLFATYVRLIVILNIWLLIRPSGIVAAVQTTTTTTTTSHNDNTLKREEHHIITDYMRRHRGREIYKSLKQKRRKLKSSKTSSFSYKKSKGRKKNDSKETNDDNLPQSIRPSIQPNYFYDMSCVHKVAQKIRDTIPEVITRNPQHCCYFDGPIVLFVTHSGLSITTSSGLEEFWDIMYKSLLSTAMQVGYCFILTGVNPASINVTHSLSDVMINVIRYVSTVTNVRVIMTTDPTDNIRLAEEIRFVTDSVIGGPLIGVFNIGYNNIVIESLLSGKSKLPYIGHIDDREYGRNSAVQAQKFLGNEIAIPICFNGRPELSFVGERCQAFYASSTSSSYSNNISSLVQQGTGIPCTADTSIEELYNYIVRTSANSILAHMDCCIVASNAATRVRAATGLSQTNVFNHIQRKIIVGCQDKDVRDETGFVNYVTSIPMDLLVHEVSSWVRLPLLQALIQSEESLVGQQVNPNTMFVPTNRLFPTTESLVVTEIYSTPTER